MIHDLLLFIAPSEIDSEIMKVAEYYFFIFAPFLLIGLWIILRIFFRSWQIYINRKRAERLLNKNDSDLRSTRSQVALKAFKWTSWARNNYEKFRLAWEESRPEGEESAILPIHLREFLTPEIVLDGVRNRRLAEALPGIFVALGIFGTFLGLVLGLRGLELGNLDRLESGVGQLISGLSIAFLTSLPRITSLVFLGAHISSNRFCKVEIFLRLVAIPIQRGYTSRHGNKAQDSRQHH